MQAKPNISNSGTAKSCLPLKCSNEKSKQCAYGHQQKDGCKICKCFDPCNPSGKTQLCGPEKRCFVDKKKDGTFVARCDNLSQKSKPNKSNKKNNKVTITANTKWKETGVTIAGGHGHGNETDQLATPYGLHVNADQTVYVADCGNNRIVSWKLGATNGVVVAGGHGEGNRTDQLHEPTDMILDKKTNSLIICDFKNRRVIQWFLERGTKGEIIINNIGCYGLVMDDRRNLYISDIEKHQVRRYRIGERHGTVVAGHNGLGDRLDQLNEPTYIFIDRHYSLYVSDARNNRVMKYGKDATKGIVVAGGNGYGNNLTQFSWPQGVFVDASDAVYVSDSWNHRIMRWSKGATEGTMIVNRNEEKKQDNPLTVPLALSLDQQGNIYVVDWGNARVQRFSVEQ